MSISRQANAKAEKKRQMKQFDDSRAVLWSFEDTVVHQCSAFETALHALLSATYSDVGESAGVSESNDRRYRAAARSELADAMWKNAQENAAQNVDATSGGERALCERDCEERACAIENEIFERFFVDDIGRYAERLRALVYNLRVNAHRILDKYDVATLCSLPTHELALGTDCYEWRERRCNALLSDMKRRNSTTAQPDGAPCEDVSVAQNGGERQGIFRCDKCKGHNTSYVSMQTRSADEPMTNFVTCHTCERRFRR